MTKRLKQAALVFVLVVVAAQFVQSERLSPQDIETICTAARRAEARTAGLSR